MTEIQIFSILVAVAVAGLFIVLRLERKPIVELKTVADKPRHPMSSQYVRSVIKSGLARRQMSREEIIKVSYLSAEDTALILDLMVKAGEIVASNQSDNPFYSLPSGNGIDVV